MFTIDSLEILSECEKSLRKNIKPGTYYFNNNHKGTDSLISKVPNFWGKNINVQAIVGKNGSGKSTLMDLMYMAINNFSYMFERGNKRKRPGAMEMSFVLGLQVNLYFSADNDEYVLECGEKSVWLKKKDGTELTPNLTLDEIGSSDDDKYKKRYSEDSEIASLVVDFFYTIVSNYSMQSFVDENYKTDIYQYWDEEDCKEVEKYTSEHLANHDYPESNYSWISPIFHKNDGYVRSIVLNPYRHNGTIDLNNEYELSKDRICSLFIYSRILGRNFWGRYFFENLDIKYRESICKNENQMYALKSMLGEFMDASDLANFRATEFNPDYIKITFKDELKNKISKITKIDTRHNYFDESMVYIQLKTLKIISKYSDYSKYKDVFHVSFTSNEIIHDEPPFKGMVSDVCSEIYIDVVGGKENECDNLLTKIFSDKTHITKKIRRTINFLKLDMGNFPKNESFGVNLTEFIKKFANKSIFFNKDGEYDPTKINEWISPQIIDDCLPPPIFDWKLILNKYDENGEIVKVDKDADGNSYEKIENGKYKKNGVEIEAKDVPNLEIPYNQLSSGEIQFLQTISIHTYHTMNLMSVPDDDNHPKYKNFNLVFDEVEICFHPEMQRQFLNKLITVLKDMKANIGNSINIFIITHSPFILSDIPASNVLFLKDGRPDNEAKKRITFAENIGEMMYDSFFMEKTIGDFAENKLKELIRKRQGKKTTMSDKEAKFILDNIGDPVIKSLIEEIGKNDGEA